MTDLNEAASMSWCTLNWFSGVLGKQVATCVLLPDTGPGPFPVFYLLHGLSDDHTIWHRRTRIETYITGMPLMVVMPDGFRGFYTDNHDGPAYARYIGEELPAQIERTFPARNDRGGRCIGGLSMGGYGALRVGLGYPERFGSITSHSGAVRFSPQLHSVLGPAEVRHIFGKKPAGTDHDLVHLARKAKRKGRLPAIRLDCGTDDFLFPDNQELHRRLTGLAVPHEYQTFPGTHSWDYWDEHIREALAFHQRHIRPRRPRP